MFADPIDLMIVDDPNRQSRLIDQRIDIRQVEPMGNSWVSKRSNPINQMVGREADGKLRLD